MKIVIDARCVGIRMHGIARYTLNLVRHLAEIDSRITYYVLHTPEVSPSLFGASKNIKTFTVNQKLYSMAEQLLLPGLIKKIDPDIYHSPTFSAPVIQRCPTVMTIHDMIHLTGPKTARSPFYRLYYSLIVKTAALKAERVITVSEFSKNEISRLLCIPAKKIEVIYNGIDNCFFEPEKRELRVSLPISGYCLFVGNEKPHKNVETLLKAYTLAKKKNRSLPPLALAGVSRSRVVEMITPDMINGILFPALNSDVDLAAAYRLASMFIAPSLQEGFGFPVIEAMAAGTPVITSDIPVMREITDGAALLAAPRDVKAISEAMLMLHGDDALKNKLKEAGKRRAAYFTLKKTAEQTLDIYRDIAALRSLRV